MTGWLQTVSPSPSHCIAMGPSLSPLGTIAKLVIRDSLRGARNKG